MLIGGMTEKLAVAEHAHTILINWEETTCWTGQVELLVRRPCIHIQMIPAKELVLQPRQRAGDSLGWGSRVAGPQ